MSDSQTTIEIHYVEIVTSDVVATCRMLEAQHGVIFSEPDEHLGGARTATLASGSRYGVRPSLSEAELPVTRCYLRVANLEAAVAAAEAAGATALLPEMVMGGGLGRIAIVSVGEVEHGFWEVA